MSYTNYPFSAILGQDEMILAILINIVNPGIGGLLIKGHKGSGKSTAVYSMSDIIPPIQINENCKYNCDPEKPQSLCDYCQSESNSYKRIEKSVEIVSIPLSVTEDNLLGSVDVEFLLKNREQRFIPGLIAKAHRQILYIDEVNLLPDHIVDDILDVAATSWNRIEREGFSIQHLADFILIGTMNPEEGELRPQILDRFAISVYLKPVTDPGIRKEIIRRNLEFEKNPQGFVNKCESQTNAIKELITLSKLKLEKVQLSTDLYDLVVYFCAINKIDGHRADINIIKTAVTYAALELKDSVESKHINQAVKLALGHRTRDGGMMKPMSPDEIDQSLKDIKTQLPSKKQKSYVDYQNLNFLNGGFLEPSKKV